MGTAGQNARTGCRVTRAGLGYRGRGRRGHLLEPPSALPLQVASADPGALLKPSFWKQRTSLHAAASRGAVSALALVLSAAAQHTAAAAAAGSGDGRTLSEFVNAPDSAGDTSLALASKNG